jgi:hypothetical protein
MVIANKINGEVDYILRKEGRTILAPGEQVVIGMNGQGSSLSVFIEPGDTCLYAVSVSQSAIVLVEADAGKFIPANAEDSSETNDFYIEKGSACLIENRADSTGSITVDWRI